jgi:hypothetical protein
VELGDFDVLILPSGSYRTALADDNLDAVRSWIRRGGKVIAIGGAARFLAGKSGFGLKMQSSPENGASSDSSDADPTLRPYAERNRRSVSEAVVGALFAAAVDGTHPLAYGLPETLPVLRQSSSSAARLAKGWNVGVLSSGAPISGFAGHETEARMKGSLALGVEDIGRGTVVYLMDDPLFRGMWHAGAVVFGNAVFAVGTD